MWANRQSRDDSKLPEKKKTFETNILKFFFFFFLKGHLFPIFVMLQIKIIHIYLSMSRTIDCVFYNPVENSSCGHQKFPWCPSKICTLQSPHPLGISIDHPWKGGGGGVWIFSGRDSCSLHYFINNLLWICFVCPELV